VSTRCMINRKMKIQRDRPDGPLNFLGIGVAMADHGDIEHRYFVDCGQKDAKGRPVVRHEEVTRHFG